MHPIRWIVGGVVVVVLAVGGFLAWYVLGDTAPAKPTLSATAPVDAGGGSSPAGNWVIARGAKVFVGYRMTEVFAGDVVHKTAVGRTPTVDGTAAIAGDRVTAADVTADLRDLSSDRSTRDDYIHTHAIESDTYPKTEFKLTKPIALPANLQKGQQVHVTATGTFTLHGVTHTITVPLDARWDGSTIEAVGNAPIVLADYKIVPPDTSVVKVDSKGSFDLSLVFTKP